MKNHDKSYLMSKTTSEKIIKISPSLKNVVNERFRPLSDQQKKFEAILTVHFGVMIFLKIWDFYEKS